MLLSVDLSLIYVPATSWLERPSEDGFGEGMLIKHDPIMVGIRLS